MTESSCGDPRFKSDEIFKLINREFITLKKGETRQYNEHLKTCLNLFIEHMKNVDPLFKACYQRIAYVGSFYEGLKVGKPEEFDLNVIIKLPIDYGCLKPVVASQKPGYVKLKADSDVLPKLQKHPRWNNEYKKMHSWFDKNSYLNQNKFRQWFESVVDRAFTSLPDCSGPYETRLDRSPKYIARKLCFTKSGPAFTLQIDVPGGHIVNVDLVPVLEFTTPPSNPFKDRNTTMEKWFTIAKPLREGNDHILWRPSFYEKELELLKGKSKQTIRQMKKFRDTQKLDSIASYYIKTLFLWELNKRGVDFEKWSCTSLFFHMLKRLYEACRKHEILDFWNTDNNLLSNIHTESMKNISGQLNGIIKVIESRIGTDPYIIANYILPENERRQLGMLGISTQMASTSLTCRPEALVPESEDNNGFLEGTWNSFWEPRTV